MAEDTQEEQIEETPQEETVEEEVVVEETPEGEGESEEQEPKAIDPEEYEVGVREAPDEEELDYGEDIDPQDAETIGKVVEKQTASVKQRLQDQQDQLEVDSYLKDNPQLNKYRGVILKHMKHSAYSKIPVKNIAAMVASEDLMKMGAKAERDAQAKADATKTKGQTARKPKGGAMDWDKASPETVEEQISKVKGHRV